MQRVHSSHRNRGRVERGHQSGQRDNGTEDNIIGEEEERGKGHGNSNRMARLLQRRVTVSLSLRSVLIFGVCMYLFTYYNMIDKQYYDPLSISSFGVLGTTKKSSTSPSIYTEEQRPQMSRVNDDHKQCMLLWNDAFSKERKKKTLGVPILFRSACILIFFFFSFSTIQSPLQAEFGWHRRRSNHIPA